ncbi:MAG: endonuclease domain-containing protein [Nitrososphaeraceae archaeon]
MPPDIGDYSFKAPPPTYSEIKLRSLLRSKKIAFKDSQIIWYTGCDRYTPDLLIGKRLIVEVDGKVHDKDFQKTPDRIRQRGLENMGYYVLRIRNEEIQNTPDAVAERIIQRYFEVAGDDARERRGAIKITELEEPFHFEPIPKEITNDNLRLWALLFNKDLMTNESTWSVDYFKQSLTQRHAKLVTNQCAMEKFILLLLGLNLHKREDGNLDFKYFLNFLKKSIDILRRLFSQEASTVDIHLKNMYNISVPGFFKNLIFNGGPNINPGIVSIENEDSLNYHIDSFNTNFSDLGITVERRDIKTECAATLTKLSKKDDYNNNNELSKYNWLIEWMNKQI